MIVCGNCGAKDETWNDGTITVCSKCGVILEENELESELEFIKIAGTDSYAQIGNIVNQDNMHIHYRINSNLEGIRKIVSPYGRETRVNRSQRDLFELMQIKCNELGLGNEYETEVKQLIKQCIGEKITYKSKTTIWLASILYIVVRNHGLSYSMMDIATVMHVNLWELAKYYRKFVSENNFHLPPVNATLLVDRLVHLLLTDEELNTPTHVNIVKLSKMLVEIMKIKQLHTGRRPSSLAGAAIKFVAENLGKKFTYKEIQNCLGFGSTSIRKRYKEIKSFITENCTLLPIFGDTPISSQDIASKIDVIIQCIYIESGANQANQKVDQYSEEMLADVEEVLDSYQNEVESNKSSEEDESDFDTDKQFDNISTSVSDVVEIYDSKSDVEVLSIHSDEEYNNDTNITPIIRKKQIHPPSYQKKLSEEEIQKRLIDQAKKNISMDHSEDKELKKLLGSKKYFEEIHHISEKLLIDEETPQQILNQTKKNSESINENELRDLLFSPMRDQDLEGFDQLIFSDKLAKQKRIIAGTFLKRIQSKTPTKRRRIEE